MTLTAETTTGTFLSADVCSQPKSEQESGGVSVPEELAEECVKRLLEEVYRQAHFADNYSEVHLHLVAYLYLFVDIKFNFML